MLSIEQQKLGIQVVGQLVRAKENAQAQVKNDLERTLIPTLTNGAKRGDVQITADDIKTIAGGDLWAQIQTDVDDLSAFAG